jgi:hypothetical protein
VIFQTYKIAVLRNVQSLGWLLWLWFYSCAFENINTCSLSYEIY